MNSKVLVVLMIIFGTYKEVPCQYFFSYSNGVFIRMSTASFFIFVIKEKQYHAPLSSAIIIVLQTPTFNLHKTLDIPHLSFVKSPFSSYFKLLR